MTRTVEARLIDFVAELAEAETPPLSRNHYALDVCGSEARRANLLLYLREMAERRPKLMLVGEAPGYRGCRLTGVPFSSEYLLVRGTRSGLFGVEKGYIVPCEGEVKTNEATATIAWDVLDDLRIAPLMWNAYPFHPFQAENEKSNRAPTHSEVRAGAGCLRALIEIYEIATVIAVGSKAADALHYAGLPAGRVRHPSHGGKKAFSEGLAAALHGAAMRPGME